MRRQEALSGQTKNAENLKDSYETLKRGSSKFLALKSSHEKVSKELATSTQRQTELEERVKDLQNTRILRWFLAGAVLNYIPTDFQIHMLNSWQIPMMILVTKGLYESIVPVIARWKFGIRNSEFGLGDRAKRLVVVAFVLAVLPTNVYLWAWRFVDLARHDYPFYLHRDDIAALDWLRENVSPNDVVLCSLTVGQYVPAVSGNTAFLAHWAQTVDFYDKRDRVARFFNAATSDGERAETLYAFGVDYVLHGLVERELGDYDPATVPWLALVFSAPQVDVYRVKDNELPLAFDPGGTP